MILWMLGCGAGPAAPEAPPPAPLPAGTARVHVQGEELRVDEVVVGPWAAHERAPTDEDHGPLIDGLASAAGRPLRVELPGDTPFWKLRQVLGSAKAAGTGPASLAAAGESEVVELLEPARYGLGGVCEAPIPVSGVEPLVTLSLQSGVDGAWVVATATFLPITDRGPVDGYPASCLQVPGCEVLYPEGPLRAACAAGEAEGADRRVELGGEHGCLLPIARTPDQVSVWRQDVPAVAERLGLPDRPLLVVMPEARNRVDALVAMLAGLKQAHVRAPVGATMLVEGNDGPPVCTATVRDRASFEAAGARWLGSLRRPEPKEIP